MAEYHHKFPREVFWHNEDMVVRSQYFEDDDKAREAIASIEKHNAMMGYSFKPVYNIRARVPIERKGAGRKKQ